MRLRRENRDALQADFHRFYHTNLDQVTLLDFRALVKYLPPEAAIHGHGWSIEAMILADLVHVQTGKPHPGDPRNKRKNARPSREALRDAYERAEKRRKELGITESVLRQGGG